MTKIGAYEVLKRLGRGGMGSVYLADDPKLGRKVAIKVLHSELSEQDVFIARFEREARMMAQVSHPNLVHIYDVGKQGKLNYFVMEYIDGKPLSEMIKEHGRLSLEDSFRFVGQILGALEKIHQKGLVHRDIKPSNIIIDSEGRAVLMDFGLAKPVGEGGLTTTSSLIGTPEYLSPQQIEGKEADARSDIYAVGCLLYHCLCGFPPFRGKSTASILQAHLRKKPVPASRLVEGLPRELDSIIFRCLEKKSERRYSNVCEMASDMVGIIETAELRTLAFSEDERVTQPATPQRPRRKRWWLVAVVAFFILFFALAGLSTLSSRTPQVVVQTVNGEVRGRLLSIDAQTGTVRLKTEEGTTELKVRDLQEIEFVR